MEEMPGKYEGLVEALGGEDVMDCEEVSFVMSFWGNGVGISDRNNGGKE